VIEKWRSCVCLVCMTYWPPLETHLFMLGFCLFFAHAPGIVVPPSQCQHAPAMEKVSLWTDVSWKVAILHWERANKDFEKCLHTTAHDIYTMAHLAFNSGGVAYHRLRRWLLRTRLAYITNNIVAPPPLASHGMFICKREVCTPWFHLLFQYLYCLSQRCCSRWCCSVRLVW